jgi:response regulator RpfG family c-di-GMP phosphodiesterase
MASSDDVMVPDQSMPGMSGAEFLRWAKDIYTESVCMILSGNVDLPAAIVAVNDDAITRFLLKPWEVGNLEAYRGSHSIQGVGRRQPAPPVNAGKRDQDGRH